MELKMHRWLIAILLLGGVAVAQEESSERSVPAFERVAATERKEDVLPQQTVNRLHETLLKVMREGERLGYEGRYRLLEPVVQEVFDFKVIARFSVGPFWEKLSEEQRKLLQEKLAQYATASYAAEFKDYGGETFEIVEIKPFRRRFRTVKALLKSPDETVAFLYLLRKVEDRWKIFDVRADGVSDLALKRAQFTEILKKDGFEALIKRLDDKIKAYAAGKEKPELKRSAKASKPKAGQSLESKEREAQPSGSS